MTTNRPRIAVGGIRHETNTFSSLRTTLEDFHVRRGQEILDDELWSLFPDVDWVPTLQAGTTPSNDSGAIERTEAVISNNRIHPADAISMGRRCSS